MAARRYHVAGTGHRPKWHRKGTRFGEKHVTATGARAARRLDHHEVEDVDRL